MHLLIITQKIDELDPILGFFHRWVEELAKNCQKVTVICLERGGNHLPAKVKILSLGKERKVGRLKYLINFYRYLWRERKSYNTVFVHMNQEYVLLAGWWWRLTGKKIFLWRNHPQGSWLTRLAVFWSDRVFCTSPQSYTAHFAKTKIMPVGIDTDLFRPLGQKRLLNSILFLGRLSPIKRPELLIEALALLAKQKIDFTAALVGPAADGDYLERLRQLVKKHGLDERIKFFPAAVPHETVDWYNRYEVLVNLTTTGSLDKTIFEAMAAGTLILVSNRFLAGEVDGQLICKENDSKDLVAKLENIFRLTSKRKAELSSSLRDYVLAKHSLQKLMVELFQAKQSDNNEKNI